MPMMMAVTAIAMLMPPAIMKASGRVSGSGSNPKVLCPGVYDVAISLNLACGRPHPRGDHLGKNCKIGERKPASLLDAAFFQLSSTFSRAPTRSVILSGENLDGVENNGP